MSKNEKEMISELLTDEQMKLMILSEEKELEELKQQQSISLVETDEEEVAAIPVPRPVVQSNEMKTEMKTEVTHETHKYRHSEEVAKHVDNGMNNMEIAQVLGIPLPKVITIRRSLGI